jgi:hypothetical protein
MPLALTSLLTLIVQPIGSAAISRMPLALESLAAWTVISGLSFLLRSFGIAYNEVVVALLDEPLSSSSLWRFTKVLAIATTSFLLLMQITPLSDIWFLRISALPQNLAEIAKNGLWFALPTPAIAAFQSWYQGCILHGRKTRGIPESVVIFLVTATIVLGFGIAFQSVTGLYVALFAYSISMFTQTIWLGFRSHPILDRIFEQDESIQQTILDDPM